MKIFKTLTIIIAIIATLLIACESKPDATYIGFVEEKYITQTQHGWTVFNITVKNLEGTYCNYTTNSDFYYKSEKGEKIQFKISGYNTIY